LKCTLCDCRAELGPQDRYCGECGHPASAHVREERTRDLNDIAAIYLRGENKQSRDLLLDYVRENPADVRAWTILGNVHKDLGEYLDAERAYLKAIGLDPKAYKAYNGLGVLYDREGDDDRAMEYYTRALEINPRYAQAYTSMSVVELKRRNDRRALELAQKAYQLDNKDPIIISNLAVAYHYNNMFTDRDRLYEECRKRGCRDLQALDRIFRGKISVRH
jgi:Flp pilus assembly protein TadD